MSTLLFVFTIILNVAGFVFAGIYIWLNLFSGISDLETRNASALRIIRFAALLTLGVALLSCLLAGAGTVDSVIARTAGLYAFVAVTWLLVLLVSGGAIGYMLISKKTFLPSLSKAMKKLLVVSLWATGAAVLLSWLFS